MAAAFDIYKTRIKEILKQSGKKSVPFKTLYNKCKGKSKKLPEFKRALSELIKDGVVLETKAGFKLAAESGADSAETEEASGETEASEETEASTEEGN